MKTFPRLLILMTILLCSGFSSDEAWIVGTESKLAIHGTTNVNTFTCKMNSYTGHDTLRYINNLTASRLEFTSNRMTIPITSFNCGAPQISRDFHKTLKSDRHPELDIKFVSLESKPLDKGSAVKGIVDITLAGVTTRYCIRFTLKSENTAVRLSGTQRVNFSDFNLQAPQKLQGLIRVREMLNVEFDLVLKAV